MNELLDDIISVTHIMGGMLEFIEKGTYHNSLKISSHKYHKVWRRKVKDDPCQGTLSVNRKTVYNYSFHEGAFNIQAIENAEPVSEWIEVGVMVMMRD